MRNLVAAFLCVCLSGAALSAEEGREADRLEQAAEVVEAAPPPSEEPAPVEVAQEKKVRKIRPAKPSSRRGQRKAISRRKQKETTEQ